MNYPWQATVQDDEGNAVVNPVVTVWEADGVTLATVYDVTGAEIANPITGSLEGFVQFWAAEGEYRIEGASGGEETEVWSWIAGVDLSGIDAEIDTVKSESAIGVAVDVGSISIPVIVQSINTTGFYLPADGGGARYGRVSLEPSHAGKLQSADGAWWELSDEFGVNARQIGLPYASELLYTKTESVFPQLPDAPGWYPLGVPEFEHYGGRKRSSKAPYAQIYHKYNFAANVQLDVVKIADANLSALRVISGKPDTASSAPGAVIRERLPEVAARHKAKAVLNFNAFRNSDGSSGWGDSSLVPNGFLIQDGKVITGWASGTNVARDQGFTFQCDGTMKRRTRGVGDAADYVADGAWFGSSWGAWILQGGVDVSAAGASYFDTVRSARNLIGTNTAGDVVLLSFQGVTGANGPLYSELPALAATEGLVDCYLLEGGGSTQIWWDDYYAMPSSDGDYLEERTLPTALGVFCDVQGYDTGWKQLPLAAGYTAQGGIGVRLRQVGGNVYIGLGVSGTFDATNMTNVLGSSETAGATNSSSWLFYRYRPDNGFVSMRGLLSGVGGQAGTWFSGSGISMRKLFTADTTSYLAGSQSWPSKHGPHTGPVD